MPAGVLVCSLNGGVTMNLLGQFSTFAQESMLQIAVDAAAGGHDLSGFEPVQDADGQPNGFQATCKRCGLTAWVGDNGVQYSLLADVCPGNKQ